MPTKEMLVVSAYSEFAKQKDKPILVCFLWASSTSGCTKSLNRLLASAEC